MKLRFLGVGGVGCIQLVLPSKARRETPFVASELEMSQYEVHGPSYFLGGSGETRHR